MAKFKIGDRVAFHERPTDCGTIIEIVKDGPAGALYRVNWDNQLPGGVINDTVLVACKIDSN